MMHYLPLVCFLLVLKIAALSAFGGPRRLFEFIRDCLTISDDHWTWTTRSGESFEDAEIEAIEAGELVLRHRYGVARLDVDRLSEKSRHLLIQTEKWADYAASVPASNRITPFRLETASVEAA